MANRKLRAMSKIKPLINQSPVSIATKTPSTTTTISYRKIINLKVGTDGVITATDGTFPIDFGALGDVGVTKIEFDTSELLWYNSAKTNYQAILTFYNSAATPDAPLVYEFNGVDFVLPAEITNVDSVWQIIFTLKEVTDDEVAGNIENPSEQEIFVSQQFEGKVSIPNTQYEDFIDDGIWFQNAVVEDEGEPLVALAKNTNQILIDEEKNWVLTGADQFWGYKFDRYVKRIKLTIPDNLTFFNEWYLGVVDNNDDGTSRKWLLKLNSNYICWIIPSITEVATTYSVSLIGRHVVDDVVNEVLYTNIITRVVENNFLASADWLIPNQEGASW